VYSPTLRRLRRRHRLPSREIRRQIPRRVRLCSDAFAWKSASAWHNSPTFFSVEPIAREDNRASVKKTTPRRFPPPWSATLRVLAVNHDGTGMVDDSWATHRVAWPALSLLILADNGLPNKKRRRPGRTDASHLRRTREIVAGRKLRRHYEDVTPRPRDLICDSRRKQHVGAPTLRGGDAPGLVTSTASHGANDQSKF
jgi:hypothetical protein